MHAIYCIRSFFPRAKLHNDRSYLNNMSRVVERRILPLLQHVKQVIFEFGLYDINALINFALRAASVLKTTIHNIIMSIIISKIAS